MPPLHSPTTPHPRLAACNCTHSNRVIVTSSHAFQTQDAKAKWDAILANANVPTFYNPQRVDLSRGVVDGFSYTAESVNDLVGADTITVEARVLDDKRFHCSKLKTSA